jgi:branched-chain amino acid transport system ATP-binding protein
MNVLENVMVAENLRANFNLFESVLHLPGYRRRERFAKEDALGLLHQVGLEEHAYDSATSLPYGEQRRLEIVRALATKPKLLLLDEPAAGMNPQESDDLMNFIMKIRKDFGISILLIEHHMQVVMGICDRMYVLEYGNTIAEGTPHEISSNQKVIDAYLGTDNDEIDTEAPNA